MKDRPFVLVSFPDGSSENMPVHALGRTLHRMDAVFNRIGSQISLAVRVVKGGGKAKGAITRRLTPKGLAAMRRNAKKARAASKQKRLAIAARKSKQPKGVTSVKS